MLLLLLLLSWKETGKEIMWVNLWAHTPIYKMPAKRCVLLNDKAKKGVRVHTDLCRSRDSYGSYKKKMAGLEFLPYNLVCGQQNAPQTQEPWWKRWVSLHGHPPAWLAVATNAWGVGWEDQAGLSATDRVWTGRARHSQLERGLPGPARRCQGQAGRSGVRSDLCQAVCSGNLISTSKVHCRLPASTPPAGKLPIMSPTGTILVTSIAGLRLGSPRSRCGCWESPSAFSKVTSKWQNITMHSAPEDSNRENF